jgi:hypothetical protein
MKIIDGLLTNLQKASSSAQGLKSPKSGTSDTYQRLANRIQNLLELESQGAHAGTDSDPIPIIWYKPWSAYTAISLTVDGKPEDYSPGRKEQFLPVPQSGGFEAWSEGGGIRIGVSKVYQPKTGPVSPPLRRLKKGERTITARRTDDVRKFERLLAIYGFRVAQNGMAVDHVRDLGFGGPDDKANLWPLNATANNRANEVYRQWVWVLEGGVVRVDTVENLADKRFYISRIQ